MHIPKICQIKISQCQCVTQLGFRTDSQSAVPFDTLSSFSFNVSKRDKRVLISRRPSSNISWNHSTNTTKQSANIKRIDADTHTSKHLVWILFISSALHLFIMLTADARIFASHSMWAFSDISFSYTLSFWLDFLSRLFDQMERNRVTKVRESIDCSTWFEQTFYTVPWIELEQIKCHNNKTKNVAWENVIGFSNNTYIQFDFANQFSFA